MSANASAAAPAKPTSTWPSISLRIFTASLLTTVWPIVTCPSPPIATRPLWRTVRIVVERIRMARLDIVWIDREASKTASITIVQTLPAGTRGQYSDGMSDTPPQPPGPAPLPRSPELMRAYDTGLVVVDMQERLLQAIPEAARITWNCRRLIDGAKVLGV